MKRLFTGFSCTPRALRVLSEAKLWPWVLAPGVFVTLLIPGIIAGSYLYFTAFADAFHSWLPGWAQYAWLSSFGASILWFIAALFVFFLGSQIIMAIYAPAFGILSEKIEAHLGGVSGKAFTVKEFSKDIIRALLVLAIHLVKWLGWAAVGLLFILVPVVGPACSAVFLFMVNAYFSAAGAVDPCLERRSLGIRETNNYCKEQRLGLIGVGSGFQLIMLIPVVGWLIAPGLLVSGASLYCLQEPPEKNG